MRPLVRDVDIPGGLYYNRFMGKILFVVCPPLWNGLPPAGVASLVQFLKDRGHEAFVCDLNIAFYNALGKAYQKDWTVNRDYTRVSFVTDCFQNQHGILRTLFAKIQKESPGYIGFGVYRSNKEFCVHTAKLVKREMPGVKIVFGGPEVFAMKREGFREDTGADYYIVGEGEKPLLKLLEGGAPRTQEFEQLEDLSYFPKYAEFDIAQYGRKDALPVVASRGCFNRCAFCAERLLFRGYRARKPENILEEIKYHFEKNRTRSFVFYDSLFNGDLTAMEKLLDGIIAGGMKISWEAQIGVRGAMSDSLLRKMKQSGCVNLFVGLESGSDGVLKKMKKPFTVYEALCFLHRLNSAGLQYEVSLIAHYPGETEGEFFQTLEFLRTNAPVLKKIAQISLYRNYPGAETEIPVGYNETEGIVKIEKIIETLKENRIPFTPSYINNLI